MSNRNSGIFGYLLEVIGFVLLCYICGCEWARDVVKRVVNDARIVMQEGGAE